MAPNAWMNTHQNKYKFSYNLPTVGRNLFNVFKSPQRGSGALRFDELSYYIGPHFNQSHMIALMKILRNGILNTNIPQSSIYIGRHFKFIWFWNPKLWLTPFEYMPIFLNSDMEFKTPTFRWEPLVKCFQDYPKR